MQWRVEEPHGYREPVHGLEDPEEVRTLERLELLERGLLLLLGVGQDEALHEREPVSEEHVLGPAEPDPLGSELPRLLGILREVGVRPHTEPAELVRPLEDRGERAGGLGRHDRHRADHDVARRPVDRDHVAFAHGRAVDGHALGVDVDVEPRRAAYRGLAHPACHDRGVADEPAPRGEDALGGDHPVHVVWRGLGAHEDHVLAPLRRALGVVGRERDLPDGGAR